jgi:hypothetical protein
MIEYNYRYEPFNPPFTPTDWEEYLSQPLTIFKIPGCDPDHWYASKPCHKVFDSHLNIHVGYYCPRLDTHVFIKDHE